MFQVNLIKDLKIETIEGASKDAYERAKTAISGGNGKLGELQSASIGTMQILGKNADDDISIPLPEVGSIHMKKIVEFCKHYVTDPMNEIAKPLISNDICDCCVTEFYRNFIEDYDINEIALLPLQEEN